MGSFIVFSQIRMHVRYFSWILLFVFYFKYKMAEEQPKEEGINEFVEDYLNITDEISNKLIYSYDDSRLVPFYVDHSMYLNSKLERFG